MQHISAKLQHHLLKVRYATVGSIRPYIFEREFALSLKLQILSKQELCQIYFSKSFWTLEAAVCRCSTIPVFLKITKNSQKNTKARSSENISVPDALEQGFSCDFIVTLRAPFFTEQLWVVTAID